MPASSADPAAIVEYTLQRGQLGWTIAFLLLGMPASWKGMGLVGKFVSSRFDNRDSMVKQLLDTNAEMQKEELRVRAMEAKAKIVEADAKTAQADAMQSTANAMYEIAKGIKELATQRVHP